MCFSASLWSFLPVPLHTNLLTTLQDKQQFEDSGTFFVKSKCLVGSGSQKYSRNIICSYGFTTLDFILISNIEESIGKFNTNFPISLMRR